MVESSHKAASHRHGVGGRRAAGSGETEGCCVSDVQPVRKQAETAEQITTVSRFRRSVCGAAFVLKELTAATCEALLPVFSDTVTNAAYLQAEMLCPCLRNVMKIVRNPNRWLRKLSRAAALVSLAMSTQAALSGAAFSQDGPYSYGRAPSGSATDVVDSNRDGFGVSFRGGHTAGHTVGRSDSITHMSLMPYINIDDGMLFGDSRLLRANEGGLAWSFGGGYRHYISDWDVVIGGNSYYDQDDITGADLKQWGAGAELLAHRWEARGNVYQTFGTTFDLVGQAIAPGSAAFAGNNITFTRIDTFAEALKGFDAEVGFLLPGELSERLDLRAFGGGYYYEGPNITGFSGWSTRLQADVGQWLELGLKLTDDKLFSTTLAFNATVHFGGFESQEHTTKSAIQRFRDPVRRNMNIAATTTGIDNPGQLATNPTNGLPFTVAHVNSNDAVGPFSGTVEDPFQALTSGLGAGTDIVFVHAGSVFNAAPQNIVSLLPNQKLIGEGFIQANRNTQTTVQVGALGNTFNLLLPNSPTFAGNPSLVRPMLVNTAGDAVTMATGSEFSGFIIDSPTGNGIFSNGAANTIINDVRIQNAGQSAIGLLSTTGTTTITNTTLISSAGAGDATFHVSGGNGQISFSDTDAFLLSSITNTSGQESILIENMTGGRVDMSRSSVTDNGGLGVVIQNNTGGAATIDNPNLTDGTGSGISVLNSAGIYNISKTSTQLAAITINNAAQQSILVDNASGTVNFSADVVITSRNAEGVEILNSSGTTNFTDAVTITGMGAAIGAQAGVSVHDQLAGGRVFIDEDLTIQGILGSRASLGNGILLSGNNATSSFISGEDTRILGTDLESILITGNDGIVSFTGTTFISARAIEGISILNSGGTINFGSTAGALTTILNDNTVPSTSAAFEAVANSAEIRVRSIFVDAATGNAGGGAGLHLVGNTDTITFDDVDIISVDGTGIFGLTNTLINIADGDVDSTNETAVDIEDSGIEITLESVTSTAPPDNGIRLVETNKVGNKTFTVDPNTINPVPGDGGIISDAAGAGVFLQNAGQVELRGMLLDDNQFGVFIRNTETVANLPDSTKQTFALLESTVEDSDIRGIDSRDLMGLLVDDVVFNETAATETTSEAILLDYTVRLDPDTITRFDQANDPFIVRIEDTDFTMLNSDVIAVTQSAATANGAAIQFELFRNTFDVNDTVTTSPFDDALNFDWNGPTRALIENNAFGMVSNLQQQAIQFRVRGGTEVTELSIQNNDINVDNVTTNGAAINVRTDGPAIMNSLDFSIANNDISIDDGVTGSGNSGARPTGMRFFLAQNTGLRIADNDIVSDADGATGILIDRAVAQSQFVIVSNRIGFADLGTADEIGIRFRQVIGIVDLFGNGNNQAVILQSALPGNNFVEVPFFMPAGSNNGQIIVNGVLVP